MPFNTAQAVNDGCETFDDDLEWILEKLTERAGGSFGLIFRYIGSDAPALMARTQESSSLPPAAITRISAEVRPAGTSGFQLETQELSVSGPFELPGTALSIRLLHLSFQPAPGVDIVAVVCRPASSFALLQGLVARRAYPVLARYIRLWWMHRTEKRRASAFETSIHLAELGVVLLDRRGQVLYDNAYVRKILDDRDGLRRAGQSIVPVDFADSLRFQAAIQHALLCHVTADLDGAPAPMVLLRRAESQRALILTVLPYPRRSVDPGDAAVVLYVLHPERDMRRSLGPVYRIYGLSAAEGRLVTELVKGLSMVEAAASMNVSLPTVRAQLKQVFSKTRTNRQAELVKVMLASAARSTVKVDLTLV